MNLQEQVYSVLIVSTSERNIEALSGVFSAPSFSPVQVVSSVSSAKRGLMERFFDFIILDDEPSEEGIVRFAVDIVAETEQNVYAIKVYVPKKQHETEVPRMNKSYL